MRIAGLATIAALATTALLLAGVAGAAPGDKYVALGDSYTAAPGLLRPAAGAPLLCTQSAINYPHLVAQQLGLTLKDVSCASATTADLSKSQYPLVPPQFNALTPDTKVVTVGIGGNDGNTFMDMVIECTVLNAASIIDKGAPCKAVNGSKFSDTIAADAPNIGAAIHQIHVLSPAAKVFVVGYPDVLPQSGRCYPQITLTSADMAYANGIELQLNQVLHDQAAANGATYVDLYTPSIGHDACKSRTVRWVEPPVMGHLNATPAHPNAAGQAAAAQTVAAAIQSGGA
ncbi:SGNH/GDSL hydrolase family protein [Skermania sp. ID1734]|uniref:SGNH/GDSL hydrolase family protein n=1 Tax=Skermania sp. ID1734 TaxID=2597516 RepID=UPI00117D4AF4|nr:SGNH/GDSL hydrolase family protein [Skermania sp. ID1734]TSD98026.1 SGNH/GDSL hydrolase family protein [Skermania sp. ID1734]